MNQTLIEELFRRHYKYLFMVAYNLCRQWDMSEDVVQDGFIKILTSKETFTDIIHARKYITGCIKNATFERLGRENRIRAMRWEATHEEPVETLGIILAANVSKLKSAMNQIILREIYFYGRTRKEVAEEYQINRKTVKVLEDKALTELLKLSI